MGNRLADHTVGSGSPSGDAGRGNGCRIAGGFNLPPHYTDRAPRAKGDGGEGGQREKVTGSGARTDIPSLLLIHS